MILAIDSSINYKQVTVNKYNRLVLLFYLFIHLFIYFGTFIKDANVSNFIVRCLFERY